MKIHVPNKERLKQYLQDPLYKNSIFLMLSSLASVPSGFFFWLIAARFYSTEDVGLSSAIISAMSFISILSLLGFDVSLVRFLPERKDKSGLINTCLTTSFIFSFLLAITFIVGIDLWSPSLVIIRDNKFLLLFFIFFSTISPLSTLQSSGIFAGFRKTEYSFYQTMVIFVRLAILPFLVTFGAIGIYTSYGITPILAFIFGIYLTSTILPYKPIPNIKKDIIKSIFHFSSGNYVARVCEMLPTFVLPIILINILGAEMNAYFFIVWRILLLLLTVPRFISISLLAEGSHKYKELRRDTIRASKLIYLLLGVAIIGIFLFGDHLLGIFGKKYAENSSGVLIILAVGTIPYAFNTIYATVKRVQKGVRPVIFVYGCIAMITIIGSYLLLIQNMGLFGVAYSWILANLIVAVGIIITLILSNQKKLYLNFPPFFIS